MSKVAVLTSQGKELARIPVEAFPPLMSFGYAITKGSLYKKITILPSGETAIYQLVEPSRVTK